MARSNTMSMQWAIPRTDSMPFGQVADAIRAIARCGWLAGAVGGAALYTLACPPYEWSVTAWAIPAVFLVPAGRLRPARAFCCGLLFGVLSCLGITNWAFHASLEYFAFNRVFAAAFVLLVWIAYAGIPFGLLAAAYAVASRRVSGPVRAPVAAALWIGSELVRASSLFGGMPWELLGHTQFRQLPLIQVADLGGVYAVSFVVALVSLGIGEAFAEAGLRPGARVAGHLVAPACVLALAIGYGLYSRQVYGGVPEKDTLKIAVVQGDIPNSFRWKREYFERNVVTYAELTSAGLPLRPDLIVWPENAVNFYINREPVLRAQLADVARQARLGLLVGGPRLESPMKAHNSAYLIGADGQINGYYDKRQLVPFAEYNPLGFSTRPQELAYVPGTAAEPLGVGGVQMGALICYEVLFPHLVSDLVRRGAGLLVNISNDSWLDRGDGAAPRQHFSMAVFRTIETRRYLVRASASGVSGFVSPYGRMYGLVPSDTSGTALEQVVARHEQTPYVRWGDSWVLLTLLVAGLVVGRGRRGA
ncbi:MAG: apolipoprotein N-acyltransferase [Candidatus Binatia bacterium]